VLDKEMACLAGDTVYCVGRGGRELNTEIKLSARPARYLERYADVYKILRHYLPRGRKDKNRDRRLFVKIDSYEWLPFLNRPEIGGVICAFDTSDMHRLAQDEQALAVLGRAGYVEPPPFIAEENLGEWRRLVTTLCGSDACGLVCQNLSHVTLEKGVRRMRGDYLLWCMNRASQAAYAALGLSHIAYSIEDDSMNIRDCASQQGMAYLFTHVPLFVSRIKPGLAIGSHITDRLGRKTVAREKNGLYYLLAEETVSLFNKRQKFEELGINTFCVDLSFMEPDENVLHEILDCYAQERKYPGSCMFNLKGGLK
jgi:hypothetical protein